MKSPTGTQLAPGEFRVAFGSSLNAVETSLGSPTLHVALACLAGDRAECLLAGVGETLVRHRGALFRSEARLGGYMVAEPDQDLEQAARQLYEQVFEATEGLHLYRIWNYVPQINGASSGLENYRHFCRGRSLAFERRFGAGFQQRLPAASAVGTPAGPLAVAFLAGRTAPRHFENPRQVPAFDYPEQYGPRPPSFARATVVTDGPRRQIFIAGTAAIRGHATIAPGHLDHQLACTLENLSLIGLTVGAGRDLGRTTGWRRSFKVYLRHPGDFPRIASRLQRELLQPLDAVHYLHADICRAELLIEIEATLAPEDQER